MGYFGEIMEVKFEVGNARSGIGLAKWRRGLEFMVYGVRYQWLVGIGLEGGEGEKMHN